jgi:hypothetical protein
MKTPLESRVVVGLSTFLALAAFACSGASPDGTVGTGSKNEKTPSSAQKAGDKTTSTTDPTTPGPSTPLSDTSECGKKATSAACGECCIAKNPTAYDTASEVGYACVCEATACQTACAESICATADNQNEPTAACKTCLDSKGPACDDKATAACDANADCKSVAACLTTSCGPIAAKENPGGGATPKVLSVQAAAMRAARQQ